MMRRQISIALLPLLFLALGGGLRAQPSWQPLGPIAAGPVASEIIGSGGDDLVVVAGTFLSLVDGRWHRTAASGNSLVRSATGRLYAQSSPDIVSTDRGLTWSAIGFTVRAASSRAIYARINVDGFDSLVRSTDEGTTWSGVTRPFGRRPPAVAAHSMVREIIAFDATTPGIAISADDGATWRQIAGDLDSMRALRAVVLPTAMFIGTLDQARSELVLHRSSDRGITWQEMLQTTKVINDIVEDSSGTIVMIEDGIASISRDRGTTWSPIVVGACPEQPVPVRAITLDAVGGIAAATGGGGAFRLVDGEWVETGLANLFAPYALRRRGALLHAFHASRGWESTDDGATWRCLRGAIEALGADGAWYRTASVVLRSTDLGLSWKEVAGGDELDGFRTSAPVETARGIVLVPYTSTGNDAQSGVARIEPGGIMTLARRFERYQSGALVAAPDSSAYYLAGGLLERSTDDGVTWTTIDDEHGFTALTFGADGTLYARGPLAYPSIRRSTDGGATWERIAVGAGRRPLAIKAHGATGLVVVHDDSAGSDLRVEYSADRGTTFASAMSGLAGRIPSSLYETGPAETVIGTDGGMYRMVEASGVSREPRWEILRMDLSDVSDGIPPARSGAVRAEHPPALP